MFNAFPLKLTSIQNFRGVPTDPWGLITVHIPIPYPYPYPWESPYPRQPCCVGMSLWFVLWPSHTWMVPLLGQVQWQRLPHPARRWNKQIKIADMSLSRLPLRLSVFLTRRLLLNDINKRISFNTDEIRKTSFLIQRVSVPFTTLCRPLTARIEYRIRSKNNNVSASFGGKLGLIHRCLFRRFGPQISSVSDDARETSTNQSLICLSKNKKRKKRITQTGHKGCKTTLISVLKTPKINYIKCSLWEAYVWT